MNKQTAIYLVLFFTTPSISNAQTTHASHTQATGNNEGYKLAWADEFNTNGPPDSTNWNYEHGFVRNHEFQWYQQENATCSNGLLTITAKRQSSPNPSYVAGSNDWRRNRPTIEYTSSCLITKGKHSWKYGRF